MAIKSGPMQWRFQAADDTMEHQTAYWDTSLVSIQKSSSFPKGNTIFCQKDNTHFNNNRSLLFRPFHLGPAHSIKNITACTTQATARSEAVGVVGLLLSEADKNFCWIRKTA